MLKQCLVCKSPQVDRCHIKTKGSGGTWDDDNILYLCRKHHQESHNLGWGRFCDRFPWVELTLNDKGWAFEDIFGQRKLVRVDGRRE